MAAFWAVPTFRNVLPAALAPFSGADSSSPAWPNNSTWVLRCTGSRLVPNLFPLHGNEDSTTYIITREQMLIEEVHFSFSNDHFEGNNT